MGALGLIMAPLFVLVFTFFPEDGDLIVTEHDFPSDLAQSTGPALSCRILATRLQITLVELVLLDFCRAIR